MRPNKSFSACHQRSFFHYSLKCSFETRLIRYCKSAANRLWPWVDSPVVLAFLEQASK